MPPSSTRERLDKRVFSLQPEVPCPWRARLRAHGAELIGEMQYGDTYRLAYIRGPEGIIVGPAEQLG